MITSERTAENGQKSIIYITIYIQKLAFFRKILYICSRNK